MDGRNVRSLMAAGALALGLAGLGAGLLGGTNNIARSQANGPYDIWITDNGFNPQSCTIRRNEAVRWVNKSSSVRNVKFVYLAPPTDPNNPYSTGDLQPNQVSGSFSFTIGGSNPYYEAYSPTFTGSVSTTVNGVPSCSQQPPTPTPTPTRTATPVPSTPTPTPARPPGCGVQPGCAVVVGVSRDE